MVDEVKKVERNTENAAVDTPTESVPKKNTQARDWCFTVNNPVQTEQEFLAYLESLKESDDLRYAVFQREKAPDTGTPHHQGYFEFTQPKWFTTIRNLLSEKTIGVQAHVQQRRKKRSQAREYCMEEETRISPQYYECGSFIEDGERCDLNSIADDIEGGMTNMELSRKYGNKYVTVRAWADEYRQDFLERKYKKERRLNIQVTYIFGVTEVGKTRHVLDLFGDENVYRATDYGNRFTGERFDGYKGEDIIVFEEFRSQIKIEKMLNYLDVYAVELPSRFRNKWACYTKVYILSNWKLQEQYKNIQAEHPDTWDAFTRRIHKVCDFDGAAGTAARQYESKPAQQKITLADLKPLSVAEQEELGF